jgi:adenylate cyclase
MVAAAVSAGVGYIDIVTGELRLTTLYLAVIGGVTWSNGLIVGLFFCSVELAILVYANRLVGPISLDTASFYAELGANALLFVVGAFATERLRRDYTTALLHRLNLARYLPDGVSDRLAEAGLGATKAARHDAAILFVDLRGFTPLSRELGPQALFSLLRSYRQQVAAAVDAHGGIVDKFIGDGVLAVFGATRSEKSDAAAALACAEEIVQRLDAWRERRIAHGKAAPYFGVGLHWGEVLAGAIGDERRLEYTVVGDTVNVAARIESLTRRLGVPLLASEAALAAAGRAGWHRTLVADVPGIAEPLAVASPVPFGRSTPPLASRAEAV